MIREKHGLVARGHIGDSADVALNITDDPAGIVLNVGGKSVLLTPEEAEFAAEQLKAAALRLQQRSRGDYGD